jgi:hypothetical protein
MSRIIAIALFAFTVSAVSAGETAPGLPVSASWWAFESDVQGVRERPATHALFESLSLGNYRIAFEKTALKDIAAHIGVGRIGESGDAGDYEAHLCYGTDGAEKVGSICFSLGEIDGGYVSQIMLTAQAHANYTLLPKAMRPISTDTGLRPGSAFEDFVKVLGRPQKHVNGRAVWAFRIKTRVNGEAWFCYQTVDAEFQAGKATLVYFYSTTQDG